MIKSKYSLNAVDDLYAAIGFGGISVNQVMTRLVEDTSATSSSSNPPPPVAPQDLVTPQPAAKPAQAQQASNGVVVKGEAGMHVRFAQVLFTAAGRRNNRLYKRVGGACRCTRADCINVRDIVANEPERLVEVAWAGDASGTFSAEIQIIAYDHAGLLADLSLLFSQIEVPILSVSAHTNARAGTSAAKRHDVRST